MDQLSNPRAREALAATLDRLERGNPEPSASAPPRHGILRGAQRTSDAPTLTQLIAERNRELQDEATGMVGWEEDEMFDDGPVELSEWDRAELYTDIERDRAATRIQLSYRMKLFREASPKLDLEMLKTSLHLEDGAFEPPSLDVARATAAEMLPHREDGSLLSYATAGLASFDMFGVEVSSYMRFITYTGRVFWIALLLNLSNIISNLEGGQVTDFLAMHSLNNTTCLGLAYGVIEVLTSALFVGFTFWLRSTVLKHAQTRATRPLPHPAQIPAPLRGSAPARSCPRSSRLSSGAPPHSLPHVPLHPMRRSQYVSARLLTRCSPRPTLQSS